MVWTSNENFFSASRIRYEITRGNFGGAFAVKNMTGAIYVAGPLDYETRRRVSSNVLEILLGNYETWNFHGNIFWHWSAYFGNFLEILSIAFLGHKKIFEITLTNKHKFSLFILYWIICNLIISGFGLHIQFSIIYFFREWFVRGGGRILSSRIECVELLANIKHCDIFYK